MTGKIVLIIILLSSLISTLVLSVALYLHHKHNGSRLPIKLKLSCNTRKIKIDNRKIYIITKKEKNKNNKNKEENKNVNNSEKRKVVLYFHGGAYLSNIIRKHYDVCMDLANKKNHIVVLPDYPLLPLNTYVDVYNFLSNAYKIIIDELKSKNMIESEKDLVFMGDSAGGAIALSFAMKLYSQQMKVPQKIVAISPWLDIALNNEEIREYQKKDKILNYKGLKLAGEVYANFEKLDNYLVSPIYGNLDGLKDITIYIGTSDILYPDVMKFKKKVEEYKEINNTKYPNLKIVIGEEKEHIWVISEKEKKEDYENLLNEV